MDQQNANYYVMKRNPAYRSGYEQVGTAATYGDAEDIQTAHTTHLNGRPYIVPQIWEHREWESWKDEQHRQNHRA